ncbi:phage head-tail connector protein [Paenibacillus alvei]|uniref:Phage head-tail connector protein n=1 Tax=Paenibacillus alvei TaxID=44250 RepID=A0ABT4GQJ9_PAEAL|nr:phage head-tail connector protein [Paenibacillus alvei]MCY9758969.1 phage head-tail connector protein [Paenibacillus alvei]MCY9770642.1 phage head-tail connector protein [Paenibacillus alvei]
MITSLERAKKMLGLTDPEIDDQLEAQIIVASELIEQYCKRKFKRQLHLEICDKFRGNFLLLRNYPIHQVHRITPYNGGSIEDFDIDQHGMLFRRSGWPYGERSITVEYEAGFTLPGDETPERPIDIPKPLEMACAMYAQKLMDSIYTPYGVKTEQLGEMSVTYTNDELEIKIPPVVASLISPYKRLY